jgi:glyoxylase-like metal-dependent hydrolase (beta-lactamase superfamily II)
MRDDLYPGIFRVEIPLPGNPLRAINSYVIRGGNRWLMIDTGMSRPECRETMLAWLAEHSVDLGAVDFFITHFHADHLGLVAELAMPGSHVYFNRPEVALVSRTDSWSAVAAHARLHGFPEGELCEAMARHPGRCDQIRALPALTLLAEGDEIVIGGYRLMCLETPGHTPGHLCLYDARARILFSGDHVLQDITPNLSGWVEAGESLPRYLASLDKIATCDVDLVFPGHRAPFRDLRGRIAELKRHHAARADEILSLLAEGEQSAYRVASRMTWNIRCSRWEEFPALQKWFATGEALAHLQHLERRGQAVRERDAAGFRYRRVR